MIKDQAREGIAFIRRAIEEGGAYATASSPDMLIWGIALAIGYLGTYCFIRGWSCSPGVRSSAAVTAVATRERSETTLPFPRGCTALLRIMT